MDTQHRPDDSENSRMQWLTSRRELLAVGLGGLVSGCLRSQTADQEPADQGPMELSQSWDLEESSAVVHTAPDEETVYLGTREGVIAVAPSDGTRRWQQTTEPVAARPTVSESTVYVAGRNGTVYALNRDDGSVRWTFESEIGLTTVPLVVPDEELLLIGAGESNGMTVGSVGESKFPPTYLYGLTTAGERVWTIETANGNPITAVTVYSNRVYLRTVNRLATYHLTDGSQGNVSLGPHDLKWDGRGFNYHSRRIYVNEYGVYVRTQDSVTAVGHDGTKLWRYKPFDQPIEHLHQAGKIYLSAQDNALYAVDGFNGSRKWRVQLNGTPQSLHVKNGLLWSSDETGTITAIHTDSGEVETSVTAGETNDLVATSDFTTAQRYGIHSSPEKTTGWEIANLPESSSSPSADQTLNSYSEEFELSLDFNTTVAESELNEAVSDGRDLAYMCYSIRLVSVDGTQISEYNIGSTEEGVKLSGGYYQPERASTGGDETYRWFGGSQGRVTLRLGPFDSSIVPRNAVIVGTPAVDDEITATVAVNGTESDVIEFGRRGDPEESMALLQVADA